MLLAFVAAHHLFGTFSPQRVTTAWLPFLPPCSQQGCVCRFAQLPCKERGGLIQALQTPITSCGRGESGSWRVATECYHCAGHTGQVPSVPPALKISSRTLGWALFVALGAYQLLPLTR